MSAALDPIVDVHLGAEDLHLARVVMKTDVGEVGLCETEVGATRSEQPEVLTGAGGGQNLDLDATTGENDLESPSQCIVGAAGFTRCQEIFSTKTDQKADKNS